MKFHYYTLKKILIQKMNINLVKYLKDLNLIENAMLKTHGKNGKTALIQSVDKNTSIKSFMTTNDGSCLLNSMQFTENQILKLVSNSVKNHSTINGDNCKILFIYLFNIIDCLNSYKDLGEKEKIIQIIRTQSITEIYEIITENITNSNNKDLFIKISNKNEFLDNLSSLCVFYDLNNLNKILSDISYGLTIELIKNFIQNVNDLKMLKEILHFILDNMNSIIIFSDHYLLTKSNVYSDGFYIDKRFILKNYDFKSKQKGVFLIKAIADANSNKSNTFVRIDSNLSEDLIKYLHIGNEQQFSSEFLADLKSNDVNIMFTSGSLTDRQKSQLNSIKCSLVSYLDIDYINFICTRYDLEPIYLSETKDKLIDLKNLIQINEIISLDNEQLFYIKLMNANSMKLFSFIHFCSPVKMFYHQFKIYFQKVIKTILNIDFESNYSLIRCELFESITAKTCADLANTGNNNGVVYKFLNYFFETLMFKFDKGAYLNRRDYLMKHKLDTSTDVMLYEPFMLKLKCLFEALNMLKHILKLDDSIYYLKKK